MSGSRLPEGWQKSSVGNLCKKVTDGSHNPPKASEAGLPMLSAKNVNNGSIIFSETHRLISEAEFWEENKRTNIESGDVLLTIVGTLGRTAIVPQGFTPFTLQRSVAVMSTSGLEPSYFRYALENREFQIQIHENAKGTAQKGIYLNALKKLTINIAPKAEQKIIAEKLDTLLEQVDSTKARLEQIPKILKRFRQAVLGAAVNGNLTESWRRKKNSSLDKWDELVLSHIVKKVEAGKSLRCIETPPHKQQYGIVKISAVTWGEYNEEESKTLSDDSLFIESRRIAIGDFLISRANTLELLGNPVIVKKVTKNLMLSDKVLRLIMADNDKPWINIFLRSCYGRREIESRSTGNQLSMRNIGQKALLQIPIPKPPIDEQAEIVRRIEQLFAYADTIEKQVNSALSRVNNLTQSILAKAFRGELTAQWRAENPELISGENSAAALLEKIKAERAASTGRKASRKKS